MTQSLDPQLSARSCGCDPGCDNYVCERHRMEPQTPSGGHYDSLPRPEPPTWIKESVLREHSTAAAGAAQVSSVASGAAPDPMIGIGGGPTRATILPTDAKERKKYPMFTGLIAYFPDALAEVSRVSWQGNEQHNPGMSLRWDRSKSGDEQDTLTRHLAQSGTRDVDGQRHSAKVAWRSLALLQKEIEQERGLFLQPAEQSSKPTAA